jgi:hypothetical protein
MAVMGVMRALVPVSLVIIVLVLAGCGAAHNPVRRAAPNRVRTLVERHETFTIGLPKPAVLAPRTLVIR